MYTYMNIYVYTYIYIIYIYIYSRNIHIFYIHIFYIYIFYIYTYSIYICIYMYILIYTYIHTYTYIPHPQATCECLIKDPLLSSTPIQERATQIKRTNALFFFPKQYLKRQHFSDFFFCKSTDPAIVHRRCWRLTFF